MKRCLDIVISTVVLALAWPLLLIAAIGIRISSPGPVFFRASRVGRHGTPFSLLKLRSMHVSRAGPVITSGRDSRIFPFGALLRTLKIDEIPQFFNVLRGEMSIVGPRPEDPAIVRRAYTPWMLETLSVRPGITGPGTIFYYAVGERMVEDGDPEGSYIRLVLPPKIAIDRAYMDRATVLSDVHYVFLTGLVILGRLIGRVVLPPDDDMRRARHWVPDGAFPGKPDL